MEKLELEIAADAGLSREVWRFYFDDRNMRLYVDAYYKEHRQSKRHAFKRDLQYERIDQRANNCKTPPLTETIKSMALALFTQKLTVKLWEEDHP